MISKSQPIQNGTPQVQSIIIVAIILFAFSGLMVGFAVGVFARPAKPPTTNNSNQTQIMANHITPTATPQPTATATEFIPLGCPVFPYPTITIVNGTTVYNASIQAKDKTGNANGICNVNLEKSVIADGLMCRLWLVKQVDNEEKNPGTHFLTSATTQLQHTDQLNQPFPEEIPNALVFNPATINEVQSCPQGSAQWTFTISPTVPAGKYNLVGLTDWQGKSYNWSWASITVGKQKQ
jgi:hypothetical protein